MCNHCWLDSPFSGTQLCCLNAHPSLLASFKCFTGSWFYSSQSELHITSNVPLQNNNNKKSTKKTHPKTNKKQPTNQKKPKNQQPHIKKNPQNLNPPYPPIPSLRCFKSLGYPTVEWCVCHKRCIWTGIKFGLSWEFQVLGCTFFPGISPLFWHGRALFFSLHLWKLKMSYSNKFLPKIFCRK